MSGPKVVGEPVQLKYCERCGGLFLRTPDDSLVTCLGCRSSLAAEPDIAELNRSGQRRKSRPVRLAKGPKPKRRDLHGMAPVEYLCAVATAEAQPW
jgi:hypothetical protein